MSGDKEATSEQSLVRERAGYDEIFHLDHKTEEGFSWLLKRETSTHSLDDKGESYDGGEVEEEEGEEGEDEGDEGGEDEEYGGEDDGTRDSLREEVPEALGTMTTNIFKNLQDHFQIPDHIPICPLVKFEKCYMGKTTDVGMYDAMFTVGLRLLLTALHH